MQTLVLSFHRIWAGRLPVRKNVRGFTLVEVLAVLLIIGLMAGVVVLSMPTPASPLVKQGHKIERHMARLSQSALMDGKPYGISIHKNEIEIVRYEQGGWKSIDKAEFGAGANTYVRLFQNGAKIDLDKAEKLAVPIIRYDTSGLATPFEMWLEASGERLIIRGEIDGLIMSEIKS